MILITINSSSYFYNTYYVIISNVLSEWLACIVQSLCPIGHSVQFTIGHFKLIIAILIEQCSIKRQTVYPKDRPLLFRS